MYTNMYTQKDTHNIMQVPDFQVFKPVNPERNDSLTIKKYGVSTKKRRLQLQSPRLWAQRGMIH